MAGGSILPVIGDLMMAPYAGAVNSGASPPDSTAETPPVSEKVPLNGPCGMPEKAARGVQRAFGTTYRHREITRRATAACSSVTALE